MVGSNPIYSSDPSEKIVGFHPFQIGFVNYFNWFQKTIIRNQYIVKWFLLGRQKNNGGGSFTVARLFVGTTKIILTNA